MTNYDLSEVLPHNAPMIFLDDVIDYDLDNQTLRAKFEITPKKVMYDKTIKGINSLSGLEFMAQAIGCYSYFKSNRQEPKPGLLLGTRLFNNAIDKFNLGETYYVEIKQAFCDNEIYAFDCKITNSSNQELQSACIKVYRHDNIEELLTNG